MIRAKMYPDNFDFEVDFDAEPWFIQALDRDILRVARCDRSYLAPYWAGTDLMWGGDYSSDSVAEFAADYNDDVSKMFTLINLRNSFKNDCGFECYINANDALNWIKENRPHLVEPIREYWAKKHGLSVLE